MGHLEKALMETIIFEDLSMATSLSRGLVHLRHSRTRFRKWLIHPAFSS